jgi:G3E family GTPase
MPCAGRPVPLTIVGGFLGAGKTSLVNHILSNAAGRSIAVLVNDFGEVNVDARLIVSVTGETVSLANGCVCCTIRDDLLTEVVKLCARPQLPEHIVIETSGVSNPLVVAETFLNPAAQRYVELRNIISVLDADLAAGDRTEYRAVAMDQIAAADLVVVNKSDLASRQERSTVRELVGLAAPRARVWETAFGVVPLEFIFDDALTAACANGRGAPMQNRDDRDHATRFAAWVFRSDRAWTFNEIQRAVGKLPNDIYRAKGTVRLAVDANAYGVFHMTGKRSWLALHEAPGREPLMTELVFIGTPEAVTNERIRTLFEEAVAEAKASADDGSGYLVTDLRAFTVYFGA